MRPVCLAVPGKVVQLWERDGTLMADVDFGGVRKQVCLQYLPEVVVGDYVIVHVGFAIQHLDEKSALETLAAFQELGLLEEEFADPFADGGGAQDFPPPRTTTEEMGS